MARMSSMLLASLVCSLVEVAMVGLAYQHSEVRNMVMEKERAVNSKAVIGRPSLKRCSSETENQNACQRVMSLAKSG